MEMKKEKISLIEMIGAVSIITDHVFEKDENGNYINYMPELFDYATRLAFASTFCDYEPSGDYDKDYDEMMDFNIDDIICNNCQASALYDAAKKKIRYIRDILVRQKQFEPIVFAAGELFDAVREETKKLVNEDGDPDDQSSPNG